MDYHYILGVAFFLLYWAVFIYSIVLHEIAHGYSSYLLGDPTAFREGRLTLNPLKHIDIFFSIIMPIVFFLTIGIPFGGAKPVPVNPYLYRSVRWGSLLSAAAGPLTNLTLACFFAGLYTLFRLMAHGQGSPTQQLLAMCLVLNLFLAIFNLLPIPPLDGSHVLGSLLPRPLQELWGKVQSLGWMPILALVILDSLLARILHMSILGMLISVPARAALLLLGAEGNLSRMAESAHLLSDGGG